MFRKFAFTALLLSLAGPVAAMPDQVHETRSRTVDVSDLNLASPAGVAALDRRIGHAARQICGTAHSPDLRARHEMHRCRQGAVASVARTRLALINTAQTYGRGGPDLAR